MLASTLSSSPSQEGFQEHHWSKGQDMLALSGDSGGTEPEGNKPRSGWCKVRGKSKGVFLCGTVEHLDLAASDCVSRSSVVYV